MSILKKLKKLVWNDRLANNNTLSKGEGWGEGLISNKIPKQVRDDRKPVTNLSTLLLNYLSTSKKKAAFTLAEVLITIGVIGVVAAMTIPSLQQAYTNHVTEVRLKKFYSTFNNAIRMAESEFGSSDYWTDYWELASDGKSPSEIEKVIEFKKFLMNSELKEIEELIKL